MGHIVVSGHVCVDILPSLPPEIAMQPGELIEIGPAAMTIGGCVGNTGGDLADLGAPVRLVATVADDQLGSVVRNVFQRRGLNTDGLTMAQDAATSYSLVLEPGGADRTLWHHPGANVEFDGTGVELDGAALLHLGYPPLLARMLTENGLPMSRLFGRARDAGVTTSLDLAVVDPRSDVAALDWAAIFAAVLPLVDIFTPSFDDLRSVLGFTQGFSTELVERLAEDFIAAGVAVVAISAGAAGMYLRTAGADRLSAGGAVLAGLPGSWADRRLWQQPMLVAEAVTTNGAGDAATAGLIYGLWLALNPDETMRLAGACAAALIAGRSTTLEAVSSIDSELGARIARLAPAADQPVTRTTKRERGTVMEPIVLPANQPEDRFYLGGSRIAQFRGQPSTSDRVPEDWIASTTTMAGHPELGLTALPTGRLLRDEIAADPVSWLGAEHVDRYGTDTKLLVKLLHAGQRLPVHAHPDSEFALRLLARPHGKAEAWYILNGGDVYLGLKEDIDPVRLLALVESQDIETLLSLLHRRRVEPGDTVYVPAGVLHAIGEDTFVAEVQEPEDLSILLEWRDFELDGRADGHLGLGFETALGAVEVRGRSEAMISALITSGGHGESVLAPTSADYFRLGRYRVSGQSELGRGFAVAIVTEGPLQLESASGRVLEVDRGATIVVPYAAGLLSTSGQGEILLCRPPAL